MLSPVFGGEELDGDTEDMGRARMRISGGRDKMLRREKKKLWAEGEEAEV